MQNIAIFIDGVRTDEYDSETSRTDFSIFFNHPKINYINMKAVCGASRDMFIFNMQYSHVLY